ncbi:MAG: peptidyl-tRNA hydrolase [Candidatus Parcubacteria bacterium]|nr:MAG: peptidyl-tRNA hydrolase [Candidatus Parcubacteria bacterium]
MKKQKIKLIYGIGNEGEKFLNTKHNLGKEIIKNYFSQPLSLKNSLYEKFNNLILATNLNYINESGKGINELQKKFKLKPENILIIHDDADLIFPLFKTSFDSGSGGHKGIESIIKSLKTKNFWRFKIGIQTKKRKEAGEIVLKKWNQQELEIVKKIKKKFKIILEKLDQGKLPNELNLAKDFFMNGD